MTDSDRRRGTALLPWLVPLALALFGTVHDGAMVLVGLLAAAIGTVATLSRSGKNEPPRVMGVLALGLFAVLLAHLATLLPVGSGLRGLAQPGLASVVDDGLALAGRTAHPLSLDPYRGLVHWSLAAGLVSLWLGSAASMRAHTHRRQLTIFLVLTSAVLFALTVVQRLTHARSIYWLSGVGGVDGGLGEARPVFGVFVNENHGGLLLAALLPLALALLRSHESDVRAMGLLGTIATAGGVFLSSSRGAYLTAAVAAWVYLVLALPRAWRIGVGLGGTALGATVMVLLGPSALLSELNQGFQEADLEDPWAGRTEIWADAVDLLTRAPVLGVGPGGYQAGFFLTKSSPRFHAATHAHMEPLQVLVEHGVLPGLLLLGLVLAAVVHGGRVYLENQDGRRGNLLGAWLASAVALAVGAMADFPMRIGAIAVLAALVLGVLTGASGPGARRLSTGQRTWLGRLQLGLTGLVTLLGLAWATQDSAEHAWGDADHHLAMGQTALELSRDDADALARFEEADGHFSVALGQRPLDSFAMLGKAQAQLLSGYPIDARETLLVAREAAPTNPWPHKYLARIHRAVLDEDLALAAYRDLLASDLGTEDPAFAALEEAVGDSPELATVLEQVIPPGRADRACLAGRLAMQRGQVDLAQSWYARAVPEDPWCRVEASNAMLQLGRAEVALEMVPDATHCSHWRARGRALLALERYPEAADVYRSAQRVCTDEDDRVRRGLARALVGAGERRGVDILQALVGDAPTDASLHREIIDAWCQLGRYDKAWEQYKELERTGKAKPRDERAARCPIGGGDPAPPASEPSDPIAP